MSIEELRARIQKAETKIKAALDEMDLPEDIYCQAEVMLDDDQGWCVVIVAGVGTEESRELRHLLN